MTSKKRLAAITATAKTDAARAPRSLIAHTAEALRIASETAATLRGGYAAELDGALEANEVSAYVLAFVAAAAELTADSFAQREALSIALAGVVGAREADAAKLATVRAAGL